MSQTFGDLDLAAKTKEVISTIVRKEVEALRPIPRYATVTSLDPLEVTYSGDPTPMPVKTGSVVPSAVGQIVRIEGPLGDRYIADVVGVIDESVEPYEPGGSNEFPDGVIIGDPDVDGWIPILPSPPDDVTGLSVTQGLEFENIYLMVEWDLIPNAAEYDLEVAEKLGANVYDLARAVRVSTNVGRVDNLQPFTEYGVRVVAVSNIGLRGNATPWYDFTTTGDNTIPPQVNAPVLSRGATTLVVNFTPLTNLQAPDVARGNGLYEVQIDTLNTFNGGHLRSYIGTSSIVAFADLTFTATWYARVRAVDTSGNLGAWSNVASLSAGQIISGEIASNAIQASHIAAGQITSDKITTGGLDAAVIKFGTMSGDRITANTMDVNRLYASTLFSTTITLGSGGQIKIGNPTTNGIYINDQGIRAYKAGATTFRIDSTGNATFAGTISAGVSITSPVITGGSIAATVFRSGAVGNPRIEIQTGAFEDGGLTENAIRFFTTSATTNGVVGGFYNQDYLAVQSAYSGGEQPGRITVAPGATHIYSGWNGFTGVETEIFMQANDLRLSSSNNVNIVIPGSWGTFKAYYDTSGGGPLWQIGLCGVRSLSSAYRLDMVRYTGSAFVEVICQSLVEYSSMKGKEDVETLAPPAGLLKKIRPTKYYRKDDDLPPEEEGAKGKARPNRRKQWGFIAEEIETIFPEAVALDAEGKPQGIYYSMFIPLLVAEMQKISERLEVLEGASK